VFSPDRIHHLANCHPYLNLSRPTIHQFAFVTNPKPCPRIPQDRVCPQQKGPLILPRSKLPTDVSPLPDGRVARRRTTLPKLPNQRGKSPRIRRKTRTRKNRPALLVALEKNRLLQLLHGKRPSWRLLVTKPPRGLLLRQIPVLHPHPHPHRRLKRRLSLSLCLLLKLLLPQLRLRHTHKVLILRRRPPPLLIPYRNHTRLGHSHILRHLNPPKPHARVVRTSIPSDRLLITLLLRLHTVHLLSMWYHRGVTIALVHRPRSPASSIPRRKAHTLFRHRCTAPPPAVSRPYTLPRLPRRYQHLHTIH